MRDTDLEALRAALASRAEDIARQILGEPTGRDARGLRFRRRGSLAVAVSGDQTGTFYDHEVGAGGDLLALIMRERGCGFGEAVAWARDVSGLDGARKPVSGQRVGDGAKVGRGPERLVAATAVATDAARERRARERAARLWERTAPVERGDVAGSYFAEARGVRLPPPGSDVRWAPEVPHWPSKTRWPALVSKVTDADTGRSLSLHLTFLAHDGGGKAPIERPKLLWPRLPTKGGCIRFDPDDAVTDGLMLAEGVESAAAMPAPAWAAISAGGIASFPVLGGIEGLTIADDGDANGAGRRAAEACAERWSAAGREVRIVGFGGAHG